MGAVPKKKPSKRRTANRRAHFKVDPRHLVPCPRCHRLRPSHQVCPHCGYYRGRQVLEVEG